MDPLHRRCQGDVEVPRAIGAGVRSWTNAFRMEAHAHARPRLVVVLSGAFDEEYGHHTRECATGTAIFRPAHEVHSERFRGSGSYVSIALDSAWFERNGGPTVLASAGLSGSSERIMQLGRAYVAQVTQADSWTALSLEGLTLELLAELCRIGGPFDRTMPQWLRTVRDAVHEARDTALSLQSLASLAGVHPGHLARAFRFHTGISVGAYIRAQRLEGARESLADARRSLAEIASASGFCDQAHFSRRFKRAYGLTPGEYRAHSVRRGTRMCGSYKTG